MSCRLSNSILLLDAPPFQHHAAQLTFLDGLGSLPQLSAYSQTAVEKLRNEAHSKLLELAPVEVEAETVPHYDPTQFIQLGTFAIPKGTKASNQNLFSFQAPTTQNNVSRVVRGCQLPKSILLEGSPGVGKTSLVSALANICGFELCRINLSDQTDLVDLFGSDLPVEGGSPGQFAWKDAEFLRAMREGHWVLLDEMNLAPQAVLEGLNAVLDHRGTVFIPELGRTFERHPSFRIFAAENPIHQGGGRKGLPKSFLNRFTKVYVQELSTEDVFIICCNLFPDIDQDLWRGMIGYTTRLHEEVMLKRSFGRMGTPWEFNLRDLIRWGTLIQRSSFPTHPGQFLSTIFLQRFRTPTDRQQAQQLFEMIFTDSPPIDTPRFTITPSFVQFGCFTGSRNGFNLGNRPGRVLRSNVPSMEAAGLCTSNGWLTILTGAHDAGKTALVRTLAQLQGRSLREIAISSSTDASDILGSFEEVDALSRTVYLRNAVRVVVEELLASLNGSKLSLHCHDFFQELDTKDSEVPITALLQRIPTLLADLQSTGSLDSRQEFLLSRLSGLVDLQYTTKFEWVDGALVTALKEGRWLLLDGANLCSPSVLDRLNSLCEAEGTLTLNERGPVNGQVEVLKPHPNFRLFMCVDTQYGELSRAMRNRGVEVAMLPTTLEGDRVIVSNYVRLPSRYLHWSAKSRASLHYELARRGCVSVPYVTKEYSIPAAPLSHEESSSDTLITILPTLHSNSIEQYAALSYFFVQSAPLALIPLLERYLAQLSNIRFEIRPLCTLFRDLAGSRLVVLDESSRHTHAQNSNIPFELLAAQVWISPPSRSTCSYLIVYFHPLAHGLPHESRLLSKVYSRSINISAPPSRRSPCLQRGFSSANSPDSLHSSEPDTLRTPDTSNATRVYCNRLHNGYSTSITGLHKPRAIRH